MLLLNHDIKDNAKNRWCNLYNLVVYMNRLDKKWQRYDYSVIIDY